MNDEKLIAYAISQGKTVVLDDEYNFGESLTDGIYESHDGCGDNHKYYDTDKECSIACIKMMNNEDYEYEIL